jgi:hypothetical protein
MSKMIEVSDQDYARIQDAAAADEMPVGEWVVTHLPLNGKLEETVSPDADAQAETAAGVLRGRVCGNHTPGGQTLAERLSGLIGVVASEGKERLSERHSEVFGDMLEAQRKAGRL